MPSRARERQLLDALWERLQPLLPPPPPRPKGGRPRVPDRECLAGIVYVLRNGSRWMDMPSDYPSGPTCWRRMKLWTQLGLWDQIHALILDELARAGQLDLSELQADATFVEAQKGGSPSDPPSAVRA